VNNILLKAKNLRIIKLSYNPICADAVSASQRQIVIEINLFDFSNFTYTKGGNNLEMKDVVTWFGSTGKN
jgi:hypothetical protein